VILENPTYLGMLQTLKPYDLTYLPVTTDDDGMRIEALPELLRQQEVMHQRCTTLDENEVK
jgi:DNA-binding transcriptional MocR family regulator